MKGYFLSFVIILLISSCQSQSPEEVLQDAKTNFLEQQNVSFRQVTYSQNPAGEIDTLKCKVDILKNT